MSEIEIDELNDALEEARESDQVASACVLYEEILTRDEEENLFSTLLYVRDLIDLGNYGQAQATLRRIHELIESENLVHWLSTQGLLHAEMGQYTEAEKCYREGFEKSSGRGDLLVMAASMAFHQGEAARAEYLVREALNSDCDRDEAFGNLGGYLASQRRFAEARDAFLEVLKIDPDNENAEEWIEDLEQLI